MFPPATALQRHDGNAVLGAQNAWAASNGAFTGEIGAQQLGEFGIKTILIGHSERRHFFGETQETIAKKFAFYKALDFHIVYCIGEPIEVRDEGSDALMSYLEDQCEGIDLEYDKLVIAYEPVWAIGTGRVPEERDIELIHGALARWTKAPLLYGGSVKTGNAALILALEHVDGALIGSGALNIDDFCAIISEAEKIMTEEK